MWATASSLLNRVDEAPYADRGGLEHRADLIAHLPLRGLIGVRADLRAWYRRKSNARTAPATMRSATQAQIRSSPVFSAVMAAATATKTMPVSNGAEFSKSESISAARIDGDIS